MESDHKIPFGDGLDNWIVGRLLPKMLTVVPDPAQYGDVDLARMHMRRIVPWEREHLWLCEGYNVAFSWYRWSDDGRWYPTIYMIPNTNGGNDYRKRWSILFDSSPYHHHKRGVHIEYTRDRIFPWLEDAVATVRYSRDRHARAPEPKKHPDSTTSLLTRPMSLARWYYERGLFPPERMAQFAKMATLSDMTEDYFEDVLTRRLEEYFLRMYVDQTHHDEVRRCMPQAPPDRPFREGFPPRGPEPPENLIPRTLGFPWLWLWWPIEMGRRPQGAPPRPAVPWQTRGAGPSGVGGSRCAKQVQRRFRHRTRSSG